MHLLFRVKCGNGNGFEKKKQISHSLKNSHCSSSLTQYIDP